MYLGFAHVFQKEAWSISSVLGWEPVSFLSHHSLTKAVAAMKQVLMLNENTSALAASILRFVFSTINRGSHDATFDLTRVGVCTWVKPTLNFKPWYKNKAADPSSTRAGELAAGILVGNLVVFPRFFSTCNSKFTHHFSSYRSGKSSDLQHDDVIPSRISWPGLPNAQPSAPPWRDQHGASKLPGEYVKLRNRGSEAVAFPSNCPDENCPIIINNTTFTTNHEIA